MGVEARFSNLSGCSIQESFAFKIIDKHVASFGSHIVRCQAAASAVRFGIVFYGADPAFQYLDNSF
jgi:alanine racemase